VTSSSIIHRRDPQVSTTAGSGWTSWPSYTQASSMMQTGGGRKESRWCGACTVNTPTWIQVNLHLIQWQKRWCVNHGTPTSPHPNSGRCLLGPGQTEAARTTKRRTWNGSKQIHPGSEGQKLLTLIKLSVLCFRDWSLLELKNSFRFDFAIRKPAAIWGNLRIVLIIYFHDHQSYG